MFRDVYPGSDFFPSRLHPGSRILIKKFTYFNPKKNKKWFLSSKKYDPCCSSRIPDPDADFPPIPDLGSRGQKAPDPGSRIRIRNTGSYTLLGTVPTHTEASRRSIKYFLIAIVNCITKTYNFASIRPWLLWWWTMRCAAVPARWRAVPARWSAVCPMCGAVPARWPQLRSWRIFCAARRNPCLSCPQEVLGMDKIILSDESFQAVVILTAWKVLYLVRKSFFEVFIYFYLLYENILPILKDARNFRLFYTRSI